MDQGQASAAQEWRTGWTLVLACFVGFSFFSMPVATTGVFVEPISDEFGWGRTLASAGVSVTAAVTALLAPAFGMMIDRYGARRLALPGLAATSLALASIALANGSVVQWLALWTAYAVISITVKTTIWTTPVSGMFEAGRGLALGLTLCGTAAAQMIAPPLCNWLIEEHG
jgi:MFS family permease